MKHVLVPILISIMPVGAVFAAPAHSDGSPTSKHRRAVDLRIKAPGDAQFAKEDVRLARQIIDDAVADVGAIMSDVPDAITFELSIVDRDLDQVDGVSGRADSPGKITIDVSSQFPGGASRAIREGLSSVVYHELHHVGVGWTMEQNRYGPGIPVAAVVEGLAIVFAERKTGKVQAGNQYPASVSNWVDEILSLPVDAPYGDWMMGRLQDGREGVGYKVGKFVVEKALHESGLSILELSRRSPYQVLSDAGVIASHAPSLEKFGDERYLAGRVDEAKASYASALQLTSDDELSLRSRLQMKLDYLERPAEVPDGSAMQWRGSYESERLDVELTWADGRLSARLPGRAAMALHPTSAHAFFVFEADVRFVFRGEAESDAAYLELHTPRGILELSRKHSIASSMECDTSEHMAECVAD